MNNRVVQCIVMLVMYRERISTSSLHTRDDSFFALMATGSDTHIDTPTHPRMLEVSIVEASRSMHIMIYLSKRESSEIHIEMKI